MGEMGKGLTVPSESIQTPGLFPHYVTAEFYNEIKNILSNLHTIPHNDKVKTGLDIFANVQMFYFFLNKRLKIEFRFILFPMIILEMFLQLDIYKILNIHYCSNV
jgi:hypothetical protein